MISPEELLALIAQQRAESDSLIDGAAADIEDAWLRFHEDLTGALDAIDWTAPDAIERLRDIEDVATAAAQDLSAATHRRVVAAQSVALELSTTAQVVLIAAQAPSWLPGRPPVTEVDLLRQSLANRSAGGFWGVSQDVADEIARVLHVGISRSAGPVETARHITDSLGDVLDGGRARALTIARTELIDAHREMAALTHKANADVLESWVWYAHLRPDTCPACVAKHGSEHDVDTPGPMGHPNCRCARVPKATGYPMPIEPGPVWFDQQPATTQKSILGPRRYDAWKAGDYPVRDWAQRRRNTDWRDAYYVGAVRTPHP